MNIPFYSRSRIFTYALIAITLMTSAGLVYGQRIDIKLEAESADIDQCRNGVTGTDPCSGSNWVNGNVGAQNSFYTEDQYLPYRMKFGDLAIGPTHTVIIGYDIKHSGAHAIDYLGSYNTLRITNRAAGTGTTRVVDPCSGITGCSGWAQSAIAIPLDTGFVTTQPNPNIGGTIYQPGFGGSLPQEFRMWGGTLLSIAYTAVDGAIGDAQVERQITLTFTASVPNPVLAWSGHVAWGGDWGNGNSAGGISGSPYHMRLIDLNGSGGNQDRSLSASAIDPTAGIFVRKQVFTLPNCINSNPDVFGFTTSANLAASFDESAGAGVQFGLQDLISTPLLQQAFCSDGDPNTNPVPTPGTYSGVLEYSGLFDGSANVVSITEGATQGWQLSDVECTQDGGDPPLVTSSIANGISITLQPYRIVRCTFSNTIQNATAAPAAIAGRVVGTNGRGISGVKMYLTDLSDGEVRVATTNTFGYYMFEDVETTLAYSLTAKGRKVTFIDATRFFTLNEDMLDMNFYAAE